MTPVKSLIMGPPPDLVFRTKGLSLVSRQPNDPEEPR